MAMINCKECGKTISSSASKCPACGVARHTWGRMAVLIIATVGILLWLAL